MASGVPVITRDFPRSVLPGRCRRGITVLLVTASLLACSTTPGPSRSISELPPLHLDNHSLSVDEVAARAPTPDLLAIDQEMREFVQLYTGGVRNRRQRLMMLHRAITGAATLNLEYDPFAQGSAQEVFHRGSANCLSYANLFVALAREAGLQASYQWLEVRPQWTRMGERVMVGLHVNTMVKLAGGGEYMVDIDPLPSRDIAGTQKMSDADAQALYHSNIAMDALAEEDLEQAWLHGVRALQISPEMPHLWVNLGAIYRMAGQHREAESSYLYALRLDPWDRSAMNNLVVLYQIEGRDEDRDYWDVRVAHYRDGNPYYHAWLGDRATEEGDWAAALQHYEEAVERLPNDSRLLYATSLIYFRLDQLQEASTYIKRAIATATLYSDINTYKLQLDAVQRKQLAGI
jgi:tetratricopeptide (TPR) repeat protein